MKSYDAYPPRPANTDLGDPGDDGWCIAAFGGVRHLADVRFPTEGMARAVAAELNEAFAQGEAARAYAIAKLLAPRVES